MSEWMPTSKELPCLHDEYFVTIKDDKDTYVMTLKYGRPTMPQRKVKGFCFYDTDDEWGDVVYDIGTEVIAWMPLPEPFNGIPSADRPQGEWKDVPPNAWEFNGIIQWRECSVCKCRSMFISNYCPNCGARMKGADDE